MHPKRKKLAYSIFTFVIEKEEIRNKISSVKRYVYGEGKGLEFRFAEIIFFYIRSCSLFVEKLSPVFFLN